MSQEHNFYFPSLFWFWYISLVGNENQSTVQTALFALVYQIKLQLLQSHQNALMQVSYSFPKECNFNLY